MPIRSRSRRLGRGWDTETSIPFFEAGGFLILNEMTASVESFLLVASV